MLEQEQEQPTHTNPYIDMMIQDFFLHRSGMFGYVMEYCLAPDKAQELDSWLDKKMEYLSKQPVEISETRLTALINESYADEKMFLSALEIRSLEDLRH